MRSEQSRKRRRTISLDTLAVEGSSNRDDCAEAVRLESDEWNTRNANYVILAGLASIITIPIFVVGT